MLLKDEILRFIEKPIPLWENELTEMLVSAKLDELKSAGLSSLDDYSTAGALADDFSGVFGEKTVISEDDDGEMIYLEYPSHEYLSNFYHEHGLIPNTSQELISQDAAGKLKQALQTLKMVEPAYRCVQRLVRTIQVLKQGDPEIDTSYSHPEIPFSIFISVCQDISNISNLRVAESILHEAMHLKLTLLESVFPLTLPNNKSSYYSPWRDEERPVRGVLHGLFVFRAIHDFCIELLSSQNKSIPAHYLEKRVDQIREEFLALRDFRMVHGLNQYGANLVTSLWPLS